MIHCLSALSVTEKLHESMQPDGGDLRFAAIESNLAEYANNCAAWHWHEFVEFAYVLEGHLAFDTPGGSVTLAPGDGYFVNANVLHMNRMAPGRGDTRFRVLQFETGLLTGASALARQYVSPVERCANLEHYPLYAADPGHRAILECLEKAIGLCGDEPEGYELEVVGRLFHLWRLLFSQIQPILRAAPESPITSNAHIKELLNYLHAHFAEPLSVPALARAAHMSEREVYRAFKNVLGTTPTLYLMRHRLNHGARLLVETDASVTDISMDCGFSSPSYFCKAFRELTGASPRDFRRASRRVE